MAGGPIHLASLRATTAALAGVLLTPELADELRGHDAALGVMLDEIAALRAWVLDPAGKPQRWAAGTSHDPYTILLGRLDAASGKLFAGFDGTDRTYGVISNARDAIDDLAGAALRLDELMRRPVGGRPYYRMLAAERLSAARNRVVATLTWLDVPEGVFARVYAEELARAKREIEPWR